MSEPMSLDIGPRMVIRCCGHATDEIRCRQIGLSIPVVFPINAMSQFRSMFDPLSRHVLTVGDLIDAAMSEMKRADRFEHRINAARTALEGDGR